MQIKGTAKEVGWALWGICDTQQGWFWREDIKAFFSLLFGKGGHYPRPPSPKLESFWSFGDQSQPQLIHQGMCFEGWIHISQPTRDVSCKLLHSCKVGK